MIAVIDDHREAYGREPRSGSRPICRVLPIAPSTYHAHVAQRADPAKASPRVRQDLVLMEQIERVHAANFGSQAPARSGGSLAGKASRWLAARCNA